ncbi:MurR/RpiR family transcriptional regulator [Paratractidigestivibacter sp.]|uniref:MurR/RpiR family transcriptional regulator n=1 Tax=Paratractidigestivibacter sp. TaxID=2847316 RepID=UPI002ABDEA15|nr:MurR/RpiR family transcriptional regulator [Paratractidigestivibacter sp.]
MNTLLRLYRAEGFSEGERAVAAWVLRDPDAFVRAPAKSVASSCNVSQATVYRLCAKMGTSGIAELKACVAADAAEWRRLRETDVDVNFPVAPGATSSDIVGALKGEYEATVASTAALIDPAELDRCAAAIRAASSVDVYATSGNLTLAENFALQMAEIGHPVNVPTNEYTRNLVLANSAPDHLGIIVSVGGHGMNMAEAPALLRQKGTPIMVLTSADTTVFDEYADYLLRIAPGENFRQKISSFSTHLSALFLLDCLYTAVFTCDYEASLGKRIENQQLLYRYFGDECCAGLV